ncbi:MAG TPA: Smr/MutS family protein [Terriglobales bacterium]|nr:Smr/MutS family protein [Terriglobales bacterium]
MTTFPIPDCPALLDLLRGFLVTGLGRAELDRLRFLTDRVSLDLLHRRLAQAQLWQQQAGNFSFVGLQASPAPLLARAHDVLEGTELLSLLGFLDTAAGLAEHASNDAWPAIAAIAGRIDPLPDLRQRLRRALLPDGSLDDNASPELARIRRQRARQRQAIEAQLAQHLRRLSADGVLQDELITQRNERFVLPVRADQRRRAPGIVHGASSSGQTVFVEPLETVELNNENIQLRDQELAETYRILADLTRGVAQAAPAIERGAAACGVLELESAKARFAAAYNGHPAEFGDTLELTNARHPVLAASLRAQSPPADVIPLSLRLGAPARVLVISGPNTGGKTVVLKTVGMAAWMAQCGLPVCADRAQLPVFDALWADVGDVQSLERNLSTFSSHLVHIRDILASAGGQTLVLLDELGTATNAAEGAALAIEIADELAQRHCWTLISTHHDALKAWASARPECVVNGSVAVDSVTLAPSFQFRLGVPGVSAGLDMAQRLGLPGQIVNGARARLSQEERDAGEYLAKLQRNLSESEDLRTELTRRQLELEQRERLLVERDRQQLEKQLAKLRADLDRRLAAFTASAEANWRRSLESLSANLTSAQKKKIAVAVAQMKRETAEAFRGEVTSLVTDGSGAAEPSITIAPQPGDLVRVRSLSRPARVLRKLSDELYELEAGALRVQIPLTEITAVVGAPAPTAGGRIRTPEVTQVKEINLIGLRMEEAADRLEKFLDLAILGEATEIRIVHGAGFGVLRKAVADVLRGHPQVAGYAHPPQNQGGQGVTIAQLK